MADLDTPTEHDCFLATFRLFRQQKRQIHTSLQSGKKSRWTQFHFYASRRELPVGANAHRSRINLMSVFFLQSILVPFQYVRLLGSTRSLVCHARPGLPPTSQRCSSHPSARARTSPVVFPVATIAEMQKIRPNLQPPPPDLPARAVRRL